MSEPVLAWLKKSLEESHSERIANKTYELERGRWGEDLPHAVKRRRKESPAHKVGLIHNTL